MGGHILENVIFNKFSKSKQNACVGESRASVPIACFLWTSEGGIWRAALEARMLGGISADEHLRGSEERLPSEGKIYEEEEYVSGAHLRRVSMEQTSEGLEWVREFLAPSSISVTPSPKWTPQKFDTNVILRVCAFSSKRVIFPKMRRLGNLRRMPKKEWYPVPKAWCPPKNIAPPNLATIQTHDSPLQKSDALYKIRYIIYINMLIVQKSRAREARESDISLFAWRFFFNTYEVLQSELRESGLPGPRWWNLRGPQGTSGSQKI